MESLQFYDEDPEESSQKIQANFSVDGVKIEEVSMVLETQELEVQEVEVMTFKNSASDEEDNLPFSEGRSNLISKVLNKFEKGESAEPSIVSETEEILHASNPVDQVREIVDLNIETCEADMVFPASEGDVLMTEKDEIPLVADTKAMEDADEDSGILHQTESDGKHALMFGGVANDHEEVDLDTLDMKLDDQQPPPEHAPEPKAAASDGGSAGEDLVEVPADFAENEKIVHKDAYEKQTEALELADTEKEGSALDPENVNTSDRDNAQAGNVSASKENPYVEKSLVSAFVSEQLFNDANLAQLKAQILVMGILRKGSKPSDDLLKSACPTSIEGTPSATVAEDIDNGAIKNPSSSRKRKSHDNQAVPFANDGIAAYLMNLLKDNLQLPQSQDVLILDDTDRQLRSAQVSAHDAMATATSALAQSHLAWTQFRLEDLSETGIAREAQITSVAATVAAAASVAKAAVEAAKAIANVSQWASTQGGKIVNGQPSASQSKRKSKSSLARNRKSGMLDSVVRAARMAAEAATQAGAVLAFANPSMQVGEAPRTHTAGEVNEAMNNATRAGSRKGRATPKKQATKKTKGHVVASPKTTPLKVSKDVSTKNDVLARRKAVDVKSGRKTKSLKTQRYNRQPVPPAKSTLPYRASMDARDSGDVNERSECMTSGSAVEIMTEEVGLRGGWFSGKISKVAQGQAFVVYDEILNDDGSKLEEWFPFNASGDPAGPRRQVRPVHPYSSFSETGSRKRRRVAMGSHTWTIGDHVDAFVQDAWWEGILFELNDFDESKATIYFPGENDTQTLKVWDLRPSMQWEDGKWVPWANSTVIENERVGTQRKEDSSDSKIKKNKPVKLNVPKLTTKVKNVKKSPEKVEASSHEVDESLPSRPTRKGKAQALSAKATKAKKISKKSEDLYNEIDKSIPSRSTRQVKLQEFTTKSPKSKKSSKNLEVPINEVSESSPSRSSRKRRGLELGSKTKKGKTNATVLDDLVVLPTSTRSTRSSPGGKKLDDVITARDSSGKKSPNKVSDKNNSGGKNTKVSNKGPQKDISTVGAPKKLDLNVGTVTTVKTTKRSETLTVTMTKTRGKLKAEAEAKKGLRAR